MRLISSADTDQIMKVFGDNLSLDERKPVDQVRHKPDCSGTEDG